MADPNENHYQAVKRILRYIKGTLHYGLCIFSQSSLNPYGFSDADWAGCPLTRRSTTVICIYLGSNCISWMSKKQSTIVKSSSEAEYKALAVAAMELITWISYILRDIRVYLQRPPILFSDNISALYLTINHLIHVRTNHIEIDYHCVREKVAFGALTTQFVSTTQQVADIFTKPLKFPITVV